MDNAADRLTTGDPAIDEALARVASFSDTDLAEQPGIFESVHSTLQQRLMDTED